LDAELDEQHLAALPTLRAHVQAFLDRFVLGSAALLRSIGLAD
jgi:hypothetical protein